MHVEPPPQARRFCSLSKARRSSPRRKTAAQIKKIGGGITNVLLKVEAPKGAGIDSAIVRVFGDNTEMYIDREREIRVLLRLNEHGFGAQASL